MNKIKISLTIFCLGIFLDMFAQQSVHTSGGNGNGSGGSVSYSIGQISYKATVGTNVKVIEGVQQPFEIQIITGLNNQLANDLNIKVYPNPTLDFITLNVDDLSQGNIYFRLYDMHGRLIENGEVLQNQTQLNLNFLPAAPYLLKVLSRKREIRTFKIFKI